MSLGFRHPRIIGIALAIAIAMPFGAVALLEQAVLETEAELPTLEVSTVALDRNGTLLRPFPIADGRWRLEARIEDVDPDYIDMLLAYEDRRFYAHRGVDVAALVRSVVMSARHGRVVSGGSTLTMQVARLIDGGKTRSVASKFRQILYAIAMERRHDKAAILTRYLNRAPFAIVTVSP